MNVRFLHKRACCMGLGPAEWHIVAVILHTLFFHHSQLPHRNTHFFKVCFSTVPASTFTQATHAIHQTRPSPRDLPPNRRSRKSRTCRARERSNRALHSALVLRCRSHIHHHHDHNYNNSSQHRRRSALRAAAAAFAGGPAARPTPDRRKSSTTITTSDGGAGSHTATAFRPGFLRPTLSTPGRLGRFARLHATGGADHDNDDADDDDKSPPAAAADDDSSVSDSSPPPPSAAVAPDGGDADGKSSTTASSGGDAAAQPEKAVAGAGAVVAVQKEGGVGGSESRQQGGGRTAAGPPKWAPRWAVDMHPALQAAVSVGLYFFHMVGGVRCFVCVIMFGVQADAERGSRAGDEMESMVGSGRQKG